MSVPPPDSGPRPDEEDLGDTDGWANEDRPEAAASDPESARQEAEDALARIEALADLDESPDDASDGAAPEDAPDPPPPPGEAAPKASAQEDAPRTGSPEDQCENGLFS